MKKIVLSVLILLIIPAKSFSNSVSGELKKWHKVTITFDGPATRESAKKNPFSDYRLNVAFTHESTGKTYTKPGYYACDGNASESSATSGSKWKVHFAPNETGIWTYVASFVTGTDCAVNEKGRKAEHIDGEQGSFRIAESDKAGRDFRSRGRIIYVGEHFLQFSGTHEYYIKIGPDSPENFLAYADFDGGFKNDGIQDKYIKTWEPHISDWKDGDPTWKDNKGKGMIGALNYLASEGLNSFSFLSMNIEGDDKNVFPYVDYDTFDRFDCSKLDQWEIVFSHADKLGLLCHFKTQETENDQLLDKGDLGRTRKLYYRELIARFSHHLGIEWNIGEENSQTDEQRKVCAKFFSDVDPYERNIVMTTFPGKQEEYDGLYGPGSEFNGAALQVEYTRVFKTTIKTINKSVQAGKKWVVANDEQGLPEIGVPVDNFVGPPDINDIRKKVLWSNLIAGGAGVMYYFGFTHSTNTSDLTANDYRSRDRSWDFARYAKGFFKKNNLPFWQMKNRDDLVSGSQVHCLAKTGEYYVIYLESGGTATLNLEGISGDFSVGRFDPRLGGSLTIGPPIPGDGIRKIVAPDSNDWVFLVTKS